MTTTVTVKNLTFQQGTTRICVPLMGQTLDELKARARTLVEVDADIIEWRADGFAQVGKSEQVLLALAEVRRILADTPLLFTFRSQRRAARRSSTRRTILRLTVRSRSAGWSR